MANKWKLTAILFCLLFLLFIIIFIIKIQAPNNFPVDSLYTVQTGTGLNSLAIDLQKENIIKSPFLFKAFSVLLGGTRGILAGDYVLATKQNSFALAYRLSHGGFDLTPIKVTIPEGLNSTEIAKIITQNFPKINPQAFQAEARTKEGYLFPDTYFFLPNISGSDIIQELEDNFAEKIEPLQSEIENSGHSFSDIIKMASILEEEARTEESRRIIAGILWKRLAAGMPLQVDASFKYINGKGTAQLSLADLKIDSPYNSYLYKGLPPTPICNPGLGAIEAAIRPVKTDFLYFLSDKNGVMHYAKNYAGHLQNKRIYLK